MEKSKFGSHPSPSSEFQDDDACPIKGHFLPLFHLKRVGWIEFTIMASNDLVRSISSAVSEAVERSVRNALQNLEAGRQSSTTVVGPAPVIQQQTRAASNPAPQVSLEAYCKNLFLDCHS